MGNAGGVRRAEAARLRARGVPGAGALEPRRLAWDGPDAGFGLREAGLRRIDRDGVSQDDGGAVLREVLERQAGLRPGRHCQFSYRGEQVGKVQPVAARGRLRAGTAVSGTGQVAELRGAGERRRWSRRGIRCGPGGPGPVPASAGAVDVCTGIEVAHVAGGRPAVCDRAEGRGQLY